MFNNNPEVVYRSKSVGAPRKQSVLGTPPIGMPAQSYRAKNIVASSVSPIFFDSHNPSIFLCAKGDEFNRRQAFLAEIKSLSPVNNRSKSAPPKFGVFFMDHEVKENEAGEANTAEPTLFQSAPHKEQSGINQASPLNSFVPITAASNNVEVTLEQLLRSSPPIANGFALAKLGAAPEQGRRASCIFKTGPKAPKTGSPLSRTTSPVKSVQFNEELQFSFDEDDSELANVNSKSFNL